MSSQADMRIEVHVESDKQYEYMSEIVAYLRSRGVGARKSDCRVLEKLLMMPARDVSRRVSVTRACSLLYVSRRTLSRRCEAGGLPHPSRILSFARVLATMRILVASNWSVHRAAHATGWCDPFCFSNTLHRLTGLRPARARRGGLVPIVRAWIDKEASTGSLILGARRPACCTFCGQVIPGECEEDEPANFRLAIR